MKVVVVDNDPLGSAQHVLAEMEHRLPLHCAVESKWGVASVRNRALKCAGSSDWVAFVDDDVIVEPQWLTLLLLAAKKFNADVVGGPVIPIFAESVPSWYVKGGFSDRPRVRTGQNPRWVGTGNVLIARKVVDVLGGFDERFGLTGGEDTEFFLRVRRTGFKMVWCDEAIVREYVGPERGNMRTQLKRSYQDAALWSRIERLHDSSLSTRIARILKGGAYIACGSLRLFFAPIGGKRSFTRAMDQVCEGIGMFGGLVDLVYEPYHPAPISRKAA